MRWLLLLPLLLLTACGDYSDGERTGVITKFSRKGLICKTWEGEMNLGGFRNERQTEGKVTRNVTVANTWAFTVEDPRLIAVIQDKLRSGETVTLSYHQELATFCRADSDDYFVVAVE